MATALLVLHLMIASALVGVVLLQRSEGGALGIGGGGGGGFLTGRGTANLLTRTTAALAAAFFMTSILLTLIAQSSAPGGSILATLRRPAGVDRTRSGRQSAPATAPAKPDTGGGGILDKLQQPSVPKTLILEPLTTQISARCCRRSLVSRSGGGWGYVAASHRCCEPFTLSFSDAALSCVRSRPF